MSRHYDMVSWSEEEIHAFTENDESRPLPTSKRVTRTEKIFLHFTEELSYYCHLSKNLYNQATYLIKQGLDNSGTWLRYKTLWDQLKDSPNYKNLPAQTAQQTLRKVDQNWNAFFRANKDYKEHPEKYLGPPRPPRYKPTNGEFQLIFTNQQVRIRKGMFKLPRKLNLEVQTRLSRHIPLRGARILPRGTGYLLEILYSKEVPEPEPTQERIAAINIGVTNLVTMANNIGVDPIVVKGGIIKAINQWFNKELSRLQSIYGQQGRKSGAKLRTLQRKRDAQINDYFHKTSRETINECIDLMIDTLVIGYNPLWKQNVNIGKRNNQNFVNIPFHKLIQQLQYKAEEIGINVIIIEEGYTSKCSFLDLEPIKEHQKYQGKRVKRGLYRSKNGMLLNADVNSAYNILRKVVPNAFAEGIADVGLHPICVPIWTSDYM
ncbi:MAG: RNA-guided endonuclease InsQ/TnpB family protein [Candidatus Hodarchaeota archaeon]